MRRAAPLLALLLMAPALAQPAPPAGAPCQMNLPSLAIVCAPEHGPGDFWTYDSYFSGANNTVVSQRETLRVVALEDFQGTPALRLVASASQFTPGDGSSPLSTDYYASHNRTSWLDARTQAVLRLEQESRETTNSSVFRVLTITWTNWTFHEPQDLYQFPVIRDDVWLVRTNATISKETVTFSHLSGSNQTRVARPPENQSVVSQEAKRSLRDHRELKTPAGTFDAIVLQGVSGNVTIHDFWAPAAGQLVRREFFGSNGTLLGVSELSAYQFAKPPGFQPPRPAPSNEWAPLAGAVAAGVGAGVLAAAFWRVRRKRPQRVQGPPEAPPEPMPPASPREPPGEPPSGPSS